MIHEITLNGTKGFRNVSCDFVDRLFANLAKKEETEALSRLKREQRE
jgi:hypothetical protein